MKQSCDFVIIGSGFGGAVAALRLTQAGREVVVLERGRRWRGKNLPPQDGDPPASPFPQLGETHFFWGRQIWRPTRQRLGLFELKQMVNLQGLLGAGVGGGSLIWANVVIAAPEAVFASGWPRDINRESLDEYYKRVQAYLRPAFVPGTPGVAGSAPTIERAEIFRQAAQKLHCHWCPVRVAINFGDAKNALPNGFGRARQMGCDFTSCGMCSAGCPQNAKNSVDLSYIAQAEALGADVRPLNEVVAIVPRASHYAVRFNRYELDGKLAERGEILARHVVLAAGTFGTTELLLRMKKSAILPGLSDALGTRFSVNGNVLSGALKEGTSPAELKEREARPGPQIASMIDYGDFVVEDFANPSWTEGIIGATQWQRVAGFALALLGRKGDPEKAARMAKDLLVYVGVGRDRAIGRLKLNKLGKLSLDWPNGINDEPVVRALHGALKQLAEAQGRKYVPNVFSIFGRPLTYHPLGGCPMGETAVSGVVDSFGRVFGYPGLYIADGSIVPTALGRNPAFTIAALSERIVEGIVMP